MLTANCVAGILGFVRLQLNPFVRSLKCPLAEVWSLWLLGRGCPLAACLSDPGPAALGAALGRVIPQPGLLPAAAGSCCVLMSCLNLPQGNACCSESSGNDVCKSRGGEVEDQFFLSVP